MHECLRQHTAQLSADCRKEELHLTIMQAQVGVRVSWEFELRLDHESSPAHPQLCHVRPHMPAAALPYRQLTKTS